VDESDTPFEIQPPPCQIAVDIPNGGESWPAMSTREIAWSTDGECGSSMQIELLIEGAFCMMISDDTVNDGSFEWHVTRCTEAIDGYSIRLTDLEMNTTDESDAGFSIPTCAITLLSPNGEEIWEDGTAHSLLWEASDCGSSVRLELLRNGQVCDLIASSTENDGILDWTVSNCEDFETGYSIKITDIETEASDTSDAVFEIPEPPCQIALISPNGGEVWVDGSVVDITWDQTGTCSDLVKLELIRDGDLCRVIDDDVPNTGSYEWAVERCAVDTSGYQVRVTDVSSQNHDDSDGTFVIRCAPCEPTVLTPNGGESWQETESYEITWEVHPCDPAVRIELLRGNSVCAVIADSTANSGSFLWQAWICDGESSDYQIRITGLACHQYDVSDGSFVINATDDSYYFPGNLSFCAGEENVEIFLHAKNSQSIKGYGMSFCFDSDIFSCVLVDLTDTRGSGAAYFEETCDAGCLRAGVVYAADCPPEIVPGEGPVLRIVFDVNPEAPTGMTFLDIVDVDPAYNTMAPCNGTAIDPILFDGTIEICTAIRRERSGAIER